jgi:2-methylcitrate dehydratase PrpD
VKAAERIAEWAVGLTLEDVPEDVVEQAKLHLLDTIGCGFAASAVGVATEGRTAMAELGGEPQASVIGLDEALPAPSAAFANAMLCHALDYDDTHPDSLAHIGVVVVPAALAAAEAGGASGRDFVAGLLVGNEVVARIGAAASGLFHERGFHPTSVCGVFGGTSAVARVAGADAATATSALGIAASFASGVFAYLNDGTPTKPIHPGWAAHGSLLAARLSALGSEGPPGAIDGRFGLYNAYVGLAPGEEGPIAEQLSDLGTRWETRRIAYKAFPACHFTHGSLAATAGLGRLDPDEIEDILVTVPATGVPLVLEPAEQKMAPRTVYEAKFSLQYSTARMLVHGSAGLSAYTSEAIADPRVLALASNVRYEIKEFSSYPGAFPGGVRITMRDGRVLEGELLYERGAAENPLTPEEIRAKFRENAGLALDPAEVEALEEAIVRVDELESVRGLLVAQKVLA